MQVWNFIFIIHIAKVYSVFHTLIIGRFVEVSFTAQDTDSNRNDYDRKNHLKKLIIKALEGTNWKLMSDGILGRLGVLSGRVKGMEHEDDLMEVLKDEKVS